jgi:hypothetical protein
MADVDVAALKRLLDEATPGPWSRYPKSRYILARETHGDPICVEFHPAVKEADRALIVAAVNALPALLARLASENVARAAQKLRDERDLPSRRMANADALDAALAAWVDPEATR